MTFCLRIDLDYVPWEAEEHGEPAMVVRLLDQAREKGWRHHFFVSTRTLRALPTLADSILNEGHDLDWICPRPDNIERDFNEAQQVFGEHGHVIEGAGLINAWPAGLPGPAPLRWYASIDGTGPGEAVIHPTLWISPKDAAKSGLGGEMWGEMVVERLAGVEGALAIRTLPSFLSRIDPRLRSLDKMISALLAAGGQMKTLREL